MFGHLQELFQLGYSSFDVGVSNEYYVGVLLILVDNNNMYLIPRSEITNNAAINLGKEYDRYKVYL